MVVRLHPPSPDYLEDIMLKKICERVVSTSQTM